MKTTKIIAMFLGMACSIGLFSCSNDDPQQPLSGPSVSTTAQTYQSLSFSWNPIQNAVQYGYRLSNEEKDYKLAGVTNSTEITFSGLDAATTYKLEVWAFAAINGEYSTPPAVTLTGTTDPLIKLDTPSLTIEETDGVVTAKWSKVDLAESYDYEITNTTNAIVASGNTAKTSLAVKGLSEGDYTFHLYATTSVGGYERSDAATETFHASASEIWRANGIYYSIELNSSWPATMVAYSNSTYTILAYYGVPGYNLEIAIDKSNANDEFSIINGSLYDTGSWKCWNVPTGISSPDMIRAYPWDNYSYFEGDASSGEIGIGLYYGEDFEWGFDTFTWGSTGIDISTLPGTYDTNCFGQERNDDTSWKWAEFSYSGYDSVVVLEGDDMISLDGFYWEDCPIFGVVNAEDGTITFESQDYYMFDDGEGYIFGASDKADNSVVAHVNADGSITMPDFGIWYRYTDGTADYKSVYGTVELTKSSASSIVKRKAAPRLSAKKKVVNHRPAKPQKMTKQSD